MRIDSKYWALAGLSAFVFGLFQLEPMLGAGTCLLVGAAIQWWESNTGDDESGEE